MLGFMLGPLMEENFRRAMYMSRGNPLRSSSSVRSVRCCWPWRAALLFIALVLPALRAKREEVLQNNAGQGSLASSENACTVRNSIRRFFRQHHMMGGLRQHRRDRFLRRVDQERSGRSPVPYRAACRDPIRRSRSASGTVILRRVVHDLARRPVFLGVLHGAVRCARTGGFCFAPSGSVAQVAFGHIARTSRAE